MSGGCVGGTESALTNHRTHVRGLRAPAWLLKIGFFGFFGPVREKPIIFTKTLVFLGSGGGVRHAYEHTCCQLQKHLKLL